MGSVQSWGIMTPKERLLTGVSALNAEFDYPHPITSLRLPQSEENLTHERVTEILAQHRRDCEQHQAQWRKDEDPVADSLLRKLGMDDPE